MTIRLDGRALGIAAIGLTTAACGTAPTGHPRADSGAAVLGIGIVGSGDSVDGAVTVDGGDGGSEGGGVGGDDGTTDSSGGDDGSATTDSGAGDGPSDSSAADGAGPEGASTDSDASNGGADGASVTIGLGVHFKSLDWSITGPHNYSGSVEFGDARSIEFVAGGIEAGSGYTLTLSGTDTDNDSCKGTSNPFNVQAGTTSDVTIVLTCTRITDGSMAADVTTGSVRVEAGVANDP
jgi:hypothetical protein